MIKYIDHNLELIETRQTSLYYKCVTCGVFLSFPNANFDGYEDMNKTIFEIQAPYINEKTQNMHHFLLSCEEYQIKKLLE